MVRSPVTMVTTGSATLSPHYIMLIRPQQALLLASIYCKLFVFKYIFEIQGSIVARNG